MNFPDHRLALYRGVDGLKQEILLLTSELEHKKKLRRIYRHLVQDWGCHYPARRELYSLMTHDGKQAVAFELLPTGVQHGVTLKEWGRHSDDLFLKKQRDGYPVDDDEDVIDGDHAVLFQRGKTPKGIASYVMVNPDWDVVSLADVHQSTCPLCLRLCPTVLKSDPYATTEPASYFVCCCDVVHDISPQDDPHRRFLQKAKEAYMQTLVSYPLSEEREIPWAAESDAHIRLDCRPRYEGSPYRGHPEEPDPRESVRFLDLLRRTFGPEPQGAQLAIGWYTYDAMFDCRASATACLFSTAEGRAYAERCRSETPMTWEG